MKKERFISHLLDELLRRAQGVFGLFSVPHFNACEVENGVVSVENPSDGCITVSVAEVVVAGSQLCRVGGLFVPPVYP